MSSDSFPMQILHHTLCICLFKWLPYGNICYVCVAICVFRWLPYANPATHSLQLNEFSSLCILVLGGNTAPHSLQFFFFFFLLSGMCCHMCLQMTSLCKSCTTLLAYVLPYVSSDDFPLPTFLEQKSIFFSPVCVANLQMTSLWKSCTTLYAYVS